MSTEEKFDVLNEWGRPTGEVSTKDDVHRRGLWHAGVHLAVTDGRGNLYQQLRGTPPYTFILPGVWDLFIAAGHVSAGESPYDTLLREAQEEVGLYLPPEGQAEGGLRLVAVVPTEMWVADARVPSGGYWHRVFDYNFVLRMRLDPNELKLEPNKVIRARSYSMDLLRAEVADSSLPAARRHAYRPPNNASLYAAVLAGLEELQL